MFTTFTENMQWFSSVIRIIFSYFHQSVTYFCWWLVSSCSLFTIMFPLMCMKQHILPWSHEHPMSFFAGFVLVWYIVSGILLIFLHLCCKCSIQYHKW